MHNVNITFLAFFKIVFSFVPFWNKKYYLVFKNDNLGECLEKDKSENAVKDFFQTTFLLFF